MKTWNQAIPFLRNDEQKIVANGYPDLRVHCILGGPVESLDVQMLFDPFEEQLNLPTFTVQFRDGQWVFNYKVVGQETIDFTRLKVLIHNKSQGFGKLSCRVIAGKPDCLVRKNSESLLTGLDLITS